MNQQAAAASQAGELERFAQGDSFLHRADPRAKMFFALAVTVVAATGQQTTGLLATLALGSLLVLWARLPLVQVGKRLLVVNGFIAVLWIFLPLQLGWGQGGFSLAFRPQAWQEAWRITLKANGIILVLLATLGTSSVNQLLHGAAHLKAPPKLLHLFLFFYRYLHVLRQERARLGLAMKVRGFRPGNNLHTYRTYANLVGTLLVKSYDRAERVYQAMLCRGYSGTYWLLDHFGWQTGDTLLCWGGGFCAAGLALLFWGNHLWN